MPYLIKMYVINSLNICTWNCNSIKKRQHEFANFLNTNKIDICCLNETKLDHTKRFNIYGYKIHRHDRNTDGGGVAILIKNNIKHCLIQTNVQTSLEHVAINLFTNNGTLTMIAAYNPPDKFIKTNDINTLLSLNRKTIILGDLNAKNIAWNCHVNNKNGNSLLKYARNNNVAIEAPYEPTHYPSNIKAKPSVIDIVLLKNLKNISKPQSLSQLSSDHNPVIFTVNFQIQILTTKPKYNFNTADWKLFKNTIRNKITNTNPNIENNATLDYQIKKLTTIIKTAIHKSVKLYNNKTQECELPLNIKMLLNLKNRARKKYQKNRTTYDLHKYKLIEYYTNNIINKWRNLKWSKFLETLCPQRGNLWKVKKHFSKDFNSIPPLKNTNNNTYVYTDTDKVELLANHFENIHNITKNLNSKYHSLKINKPVEQFLNNVNIDLNHVDLCTEEEIYCIIKTIKNKKAPGNDGVPNIVYKHLPQNAIKLIVHFINKILTTGYYPVILKSANLIPIAKPGKPRDIPVNYRPISLLTSLNKIIEKVVKFRLIEFIDINNILIPEQFGFRSHHSTVAQLVRLCDYATDAFNYNKYTGLMLFDIEKAFDTMWHKGLIYKMINLKFPNYIIKLIYSYLSNRTFRVIINGASSPEKPINAGVPQGSVIGPVLYILYINNIPKIPKTHLALYADDTAVYTSSWRLDTVANRLTQSAYKINKEFKKWRTKLNNNKTEAIMLTKRRPKSLPDIDVNWSNCVKYLGVKIDSKLNFNEHIKHVCNKALQAMFLLYPIFNKYSHLSLKNKMLLYKVCIRPILTYAAPVWSNISKSNLQSMQVIQNRCLRIIGQYPRWTLISKMHKDLNIELIENKVFNLSKKFFDNCNISSNPLISEIGVYTLTSFHYKKYKHKRIKHILL